MKNYFKTIASRVLVRPFFKFPWLILLVGLVCTIAFTVDLMSSDQKKRDYVLRVRGKTISSAIENSFYGHEMAMRIIATKIGNDCLAIDWSDHWRSNLLYENRFGIGSMGFVANPSQEKGCSKNMEGYAMQLPSDLQLTASGGAHPVVSYYSQMMLNSELREAMMKSQSKQGMYITGKVHILSSGLIKDKDDLLPSVSHLGVVVFYPVFAKNNKSDPGNFMGWLYSIHFFNETLSNLNIGGIEYNSTLLPRIQIFLTSEDEELLFDSHPFVKEINGKQEKYTMFFGGRSWLIKSQDPLIRIGFDYRKIIVLIFGLILTLIVYLLIKKLKKDFQTNKKLREKYKSQIKRKENNAVHLWESTLQGAGVISWIWDLKNESLISSDRNLNITLQNLKDGESKFDYFLHSYINQRDSERYLNTIENVFSGKMKSDACNLTAKINDSWESCVFNANAVTDKSGMSSGVIAGSFLNISLRSAAEECLITYWRIIVCFNDSVAMAIKEQGFIKFDNLLRLLSDQLVIGSAIIYRRSLAGRPGLLTETESKVDFEIARSLAIRYSGEMISESGYFVFSSKYDPSYIFVIKSVEWIVGIEDRYISSIRFIFDNFINISKISISNESGMIKKIGRSLVENSEFPQIVFDLNDENFVCSNKGFLSMMKMDAFHCDNYSDWINGQIKFMRKFGDYSMDVDNLKFHMKLAKFKGHSRCDHLLISRLNCKSVYKDVYYQKVLDSIVITFIDSALIPADGNKRIVVDGKTVADIAGVNYLIVNGSRILQSSNPLLNHLGMTHEEIISKSVLELFAVDVNESAKLMMILDRGGEVCLYFKSEIEKSNRIWKVTGKRVQLENGEDSMLLVFA